METLRNKKKLAALSKEDCEDYLGSNLTENSNVPRSQEDYITQDSEEIERRVTKGCLKSSVGQKPDIKRVITS